VEEDMEADEADKVVVEADRVVVEADRVVVEEVKVVVEVDKVDTVEDEDAEYEGQRVIAASYHRHSAYINMIVLINKGENHEIA
jgi:hypothetical protein